MSYDNSVLLCLQDGRGQAGHAYLLLKENGRILNGIEKSKARLNSNLDISIIISMSALVYTQGLSITFMIPAIGSAFIFGGILSSDMLTVNSAYYYDSVIEIPVTAEQVKELNQIIQNTAGRNEYYSLTGIGSTNCATTCVNLLKKIGINLFDYLEVPRMHRILTMPSTFITAAERIEKLSDCPNYTYEAINQGEQKRTCFTHTTKAGEFRFYR